MALGAGAPRPATLARMDDLVELTHGLRTELLARGEFLPSTWVEESAEDLRAGRLRGWTLGSPETGGIAFVSTRGGRAYAHVHVTPGDGAADRTDRLLSELRDRVEPAADRMDVGLTGLRTDDEDELLRRVADRPGETVLLRHALDAPTTSPGPPVPVPAGQRAYRVGDIELRALAALDWVGYQGTADESLVAETADEDRRVLGEILQGLLGRFLDDASIALVGDPGTLSGFLLTAEQTPRRAVFLDLMVAPDLRRTGLGTFFLRWGLRAAHALGYESVRLWVTEANRAALALYRANGFTPVGRALIYRFRGSGPLPGAAAQPH